MKNLLLSLAATVVIVSGAIYICKNLAPRTRDKHMYFVSYSLTMESGKVMNGDSVIFGTLEEIKDIEDLRTTLSIKMTHPTNCTIYNIYKMR